MEYQELIIQFERVSIKEANIYAAELKEILLNADPDVKVKQERDNPRTQDLGSTLILLFGSSAVISVANGIKNWLSKRSDSSIVITKNKDGIIKVIGKNISNETVKELANFLSNKQ